MLGLDEEKQLSWRKEEAKESSINFRQQALAKDLQSNTVTVEPDNGRDVSNILAQIGKPMTSQQLITKLQKCNRRLIFIRTKSYDMYGVYVLDPNGRTHVNERGEVLLVRHICGMESGVMPEFSVLHKTKTRLPNQELFGKAKATRDVDWQQIETFASETRGWRTVLIRLLHAGLITRYDVEAHFGWQPTYESEKWHARTQ